MCLFGFGSLCFDPELPDQVVERFSARLRGVRRAFNKRSASRFCAREESFDAFFDQAPTGFCKDGIYDSLVLGTEPDDSAHIDGLVIGYSAAAAEAALQATDRREGYVEGRASRLNGYVRVVRSVERLDGAGEQHADASVYLTNPDPHIYRAGPLTLRQQAMILINATPRERRDARDSRGLHYLEGTRASLRSVGIVDRHLEALAAAIYALDGPWLAALSPPQPALR